MKKLTPDDPEGRSPDIAAENLAKLKALFPEIVTEGPKGASVNVDVLKALVGDGTVTDAEEKYGLNWHGKRRARQLALTPSTGTLRPCPEESVDWDTTQNLMIEGDNLEVLKLLQKSYAGKVKLIYIDPPYNTGGDFIYPDDFQDSIRNYMVLTGQVDGDGRLSSSNSEASGRYHTAWLSMMYPRLKLAQSLLRKDGFIVVSINDIEQPRLRMLCDEIFGEECFVATLVWLKGKEGGNDNAGFGPHHEYLACYSPRPEVAAGTISLDEKDTSRHITELPEANLAKLGQEVYRRGEPFQLINLSKQKDYRVKVPLSDGTFIEWDSYCPQSTIDEYIRIGKIFVGARRVPYVKSFLADERAGTKPSSVIEQEFGTTKAGGIALRELFGSKDVFSYPKPPQLLARLVKVLCSQSDANRADGKPMIVLDFFAGSGTTAHGVMAQGVVDGTPRRFILVQLPEPISSEGDRTIAAEFCDKLGRPRIISELTKERLRRAAAKIRDAHPMFSGDLGFRVFKLDSTNLQEWKPKPDDLDGTLLKAVDHVKADRTEADLLYEVLLKLGLDLCVPIEARTIAGKAVQSVGGGVLMACLADRITREDVEALGQGIVEWRKALAPAGDTTCIFRDAAFADDMAKTNLASILEQNGIKKMRSL